MWCQFSLLEVLRAYSPLFASHEALWGEDAVRPAVWSCLKSNVHWSLGTASFATIDNGADAKKTLEARLENDQVCACPSQPIGIEGPLDVEKGNVS